MSSGPTTWPMDGPPVAPSIMFVDLPTVSASAPVPTPVQTTQPAVEPQPQPGSLEAQLAAIASQNVGSA